MRSVERGWSIIHIWIFFNMTVEKGAENMHFVRKMRKISCDGRGRSDRLCQRSWGCTSSQGWRGLKTRQERAGVMLWDMQRLMDYAEGLDYVDAERIGCVGFSGGGQASMWLAAMDERISLAVISGYLHNYPESMLHSHLCCCNYFLGLWELADVSDICSLIAPRPLFLGNGDEDVENGPRGIAGPVEQAEFLAWHRRGGLQSPDRWE